MGAPSFLGLDPVDLDAAEVAVWPLPLETTVSYGAGAADGPAAILAASEQVELYDHETGAELDELRIFTHAAPELPPEPERAVEAIRQRVRDDAAAGRFVLGLGGEHTVTVGLVRALADPSVGLLQIDAHADLRDEYEGEPYSHACVARRLHEDGHPVVGVGIRALCREEAEYAARERLGLFHPRDLDGANNWIGEVLRELPERVYLSLDIDGLDPAVAPGTGTPEPDGLTYRQVAALVDAVAARRRVVGADVVEVAPIPGMQVSEFAAARLATRVLARVLRPGSA